MDAIVQLIDVVEKIGTVIVILSVLYAAYLWLRGIAPALIRLGNGLSRRKIAIFARGDVCDSLHSLLKDSRLFRHTNLIPIRTRDDIGKAEPASIFLVHYPDFKDDIPAILAKKRDATALVLYAPAGGERVPDEVMARVNSVRNSTVVNLRGRLMNDIVLSMITTSYEKE